MAICGRCNGRGKAGWGRDCPACVGVGFAGVVVHEAAHVVAAREKGATRVRAKILERPNRRGWGGWTHYYGIGGKKDEAVVILAGDAAAGGCSRDDAETARRLLRGSGTSLGEAMKEARELVENNRREIRRTARRLHRRGQI